MPLRLPLPPSELIYGQSTSTYGGAGNEVVEQEQHEEASDGSGVHEALGASPQSRSTRAGIRPAGLVQAALGVQARSTGHEARDRALRAVQVDVRLGERRSSRGGSATRDAQPR